MHFLASAAARLSVDVTAASGLEEMGRLIRRDGPARGWIRAWGYEEWRLVEARHPTRWDLDRAVPGRPVVLHHRTGHAAVLSSVALGEVGQAAHPDGILVDRHDVLARVPRLEPSALARSAAEVSAEWAAAGITAFVDATHTNGPADLELLADWCGRGLVGQSVTAMIGPAHAGHGPSYGGMVGAVRVGPVKLMASAGQADRLPMEVAGAHRAGFPVAVHVVDIDVLEATLSGLEGSAPPPGAMDRIEHCALSLPEHVGRIAATGAMVVVNPSFLVLRKAKYEAELAEVEKGWLIRMGSLLRAGIPLRAGSDAPVTPARPLDIRAAATSHPFDRRESLTPREAEALLSA